MKKNTIILSTVIFLALASMSSCKKDKTNTNDSNQGTNNGTVVDLKDEIQNVSWVMKNADLPTESLRDNYESMEFTVTDNLRYSWKWKRKDGKITNYEGGIEHSKTSQTHTNNKPLWTISVNVETINGQSFPGGWMGIYTYDDNHNLILNVEPNVTGWSPHPSLTQGIGSGKSMMGSVYNFSRE